MKVDWSATPATAGLAAGRLLLAAIFILEGWSKLRGYEAAAAYMDRYGVPSVLLPAVIALELGGGIMIAVGWQTRVAALALSVFGMLAAILSSTAMSPKEATCSISRRTWRSQGASWCSLLRAQGPGRWKRPDGRRAASGRQWHSFRCMIVGLERTRRKTSAPACWHVAPALNAGLSPRPE